MGIGPSPAISNLLKKNNLSIDKIDIFDVSFLVFDMLKYF